MTARLQRWLIYPLASFGALSLACIAYIHVVMWYETHVPPPRCMALPTVSPVAKDLAGKITPGLVEAAKDYEPAFLAEASNPLSRWAGAKIYPVIVTKIPTAVEVGCDKLMTKFGGYTVDDLIALVVRHAQEKGEPVNFSMRMYQAKRSVDSND